MLKAKENMSIDTNKLEALIAQYPEITSNFNNKMPHGLSGPRFNNEIYQ